MVNPLTPIEAEQLIAPNTNPEDSRRFRVGRRLSQVCKVAAIGTIVEYGYDGISDGQLDHLTAVKWGLVAILGTLGVSIALMQPAQNRASKSYRQEHGEEPPRQQG